MPADEHLPRLPLAGVFVGRAPELQLVDDALASAIQGNGRVVLVSGEAGIGKTRLLEEIAAHARRHGTLVLWGRCDEGAAGNAYGPFRTALDGYVGEVAESTLRTQLGAGAGVIAQLVPRVHTRLADVAEPIRLQPDEERTRLFDAVSQFLIAIAVRAPLVLALDDLHWADDDTLALLRHIGRTAGRQRILLLGAYREGEVEAEGALAETVAVLRRQASFERIVLTGLALAHVEALLQALAAQRATAWPAGPVDAALSQAIGDETKGNPFFVRSLVLHLVEEGRLHVEEGRWCAPTPLDELGLPEGVRQLLGRRLARLTPDTQAFLTVAAAVGGTFRFDVVAAGAGLEDARALAAVDEALQAQLIEPAPGLDSYAFGHALVRQTLHETQNPSRRVRLHRRIAETMERVYGDRVGEHAAEIATHYHRSRTLQGAARGVTYALVAAGRAEAAYSRNEAAAALRVALDLIPDDDARRPRLYARLGLALAWGLAFAEARTVALEAARLLAATECEAEAADYLAEILTPMWEGGILQGAFTIAQEGLRYAQMRRDATWASLRAIEIICGEPEAFDNPGIPLDTPDRIEISRLLAQLPVCPNYAWRFLVRDGRWRAEHFLLSGKYRRSVERLRLLADECEAQGRIALAASYWCVASRCLIALGDFEEAQATRLRGAALAQRAPDSTTHVGALLAMGEDERRMACDENWNEPIADLGLRRRHGPPAGWYRASTDAAIARVHARMDRVDRALRRLSSAIPALERAPAWAENYTRMACDAAETLWLTKHTDHISTIEHNLRDKVVTPDYRYPMTDGRLALARLSALQGHYDEALDWFAKARTVLDEQGARPLRAIVDYDEALMYHRRGAGGDGERARPLLDAGLRQFHALGMTGWIRRADALVLELNAPADHSTAGATSATGGHDLQHAAISGEAIFRREGDYWTVAYNSATGRLKDVNGLHYLAHLLRHPSQEVHALDLIQSGDSTAAPSRFTHAASDAGPVLDPQAKAQYRNRLRELRADLEQAERFNDSGRSERLRAEIEAISEQLAAAVGLGGRDRSAASNAERARATVTQRIKTAIRRIAVHSPQLADHLASRVKTGRFCVYRPDPGRPIQWTLE